MFDIHLSNVPIINLRWEFREFFERAHLPDFLHRPEGRVLPLETRYFVWLGMPEAGVTMMLSRSVSGLESYMCYATEYAAAARALLNPRLRAAARNPFVLGGGAADNYYNRLPGLVSPDIAMKHAQPELWTKTLKFYKQIRNPVVHGHELRDIRADRFASLYDFLADIYDWIDAWYDPDDVLKQAKDSFASRHPDRAS